MTELVASEIRGGIGYLTLNRPQALNALSLEMIRAITTALNDWAVAPEVVAVAPEALCAEIRALAAQMIALHPSPPANGAAGVTREAARRVTRGRAR